MQKFLTLKPWPLFSLTVVPWMLGVFANILSAHISNQHLFETVRVLVSVCQGFAWIVAIGWFYIVTKKLHERLPASVGMSFLGFKVILITPLLCAVFAAIAGKDFWDSAFGGFPRLPFGLLLSLFLLGGPFYCVCLFTKVLVAVETQKEPAVDPRVEAFMQILFWPLGVWSLQSRINTIFAGPISAKTAPQQNNLPIPSR